MFRNQRVNDLSKKPCKTEYLFKYSSKAHTPMYFLWSKFQSLYNAATVKHIFKDIFYNDGSLKPWSNSFALLKVYNLHDLP